MKTNKRVLLTGGNGFVGRHLCGELKRRGYEVIATARASKGGIVELDILNEEMIYSVLAEVQPNYVLHVAGQSSVGASWQAPQKTLQTNLIGTVNVMEAVRQVCPAARVVLFSTSHEYGPCEDEIVSESETIQPVSPYGVSKAAQTMMGKLYHSAYGLDIVTLRLFNQIGVGQSLGFVLPDFASQVAKIEKGLQEPTIHTGSLNGIRDFTDIEDSVKQMVCVMESGKAGEVYHIGSGKGTPIRALLECLMEKATVPIEVVSKHELRRQDGKAGYFADLTKLQQLCPALSLRPISETVGDVLNEWRVKYECCD